ncbi:MAG: phosphate ABC transporter substrate-binding protein PstS family protein [Xanthomonadales bacterium]|nr:phosphate ABC transporter substrate-binding protein PstS family protein [Xanthomonadales bacterium]
MIRYTHQSGRPGARRNRSVHPSGRPSWFAWVATLALTLAASPATAQTRLDPELPPYEKVSGVSGTLSSAGSDTLANLMTLWSEEFKRFYPNVTVQIQAAGSSTAPTALTEGTANIGPMSRLMRDQEIEAFESRFGYPPTLYAVAIDALSVFVHKDNPIEGLTLAQLDGIFSATLNCSGAREIERWGELGLEGSWANREIQRYGRNSVSGTYGHFKERALCRGDFRSSVNEQPGSASVVQSVATSLNGIGYSGMGYATSSVRALPIARAAGEPYIEPSMENAIAGAYPMARFLYIYVNDPPNQPMSPLVREFVRMALSREGQAVVLRDGYVPFPAVVASRERARIEPPPPVAALKE